MNDAHWHLALNHLPIIIPVAGLLVLVGGMYCLFVFATITALIAGSTGEGAEKMVEGMLGIDEHFIEVHEDTAGIFIVLLYILGGLSLIGLWANWKKKPFSKVISIVIMAFVFVVLFYAQQTGTTGGEIRHTEIRTDETTNAPILNQIEEHEEAED
jgi:uncharacterized membrane protein